MKSIHVEPEALAAWSEGTLPPSEAGQVEAHLADCASCQEMLAVFVRTEPPHTVSSGLGSVLSGLSSVLSGVTNWRWAVPLAAAATVAAIWVAIPEEERTAQLNPTAAPALSEPAPAPASSLSADAAPTVAKQSAARPDAPADPLADRAAPEARAEKVDQLSARALEANERDQDLKAEAAPPAAPAAARQAAAASAPASAQAAQEQDQFRVEEERVAGLLRQAPAEVISPDPQVRWRIVPTGRLERSTNAGRTWETVTFPLPVNVTAVRAPGPTTAIVTAADGRQFRTDDQGKTWNLVQP